MLGPGGSSPVRALPETGASGEPHWAFGPGLGVGVGGGRL